MRAEEVIAITEAAAEVVDVRNVAETEIKTLKHALTSYEQSASLDDALKAEVLELRAALTEATQVQINQQSAQSELTARLETAEGASSVREIEFAERRDQLASKLEIAEEHAKQALAESSNTEWSISVLNSRVQMEETRVQAKQGEIDRLLSALSEKKSEILAVKCESDAQCAIHSTNMYGAEQALAATRRELQDADRASETFAASESKSRKEVDDTKRQLSVSEEALREERAARKDENAAASREIERSTALTEELRAETHRLEALEATQRAEHEVAAGAASSTSASYTSMVTTVTEENMRMERLLIEMRERHRKEEGDWMTQLAEAARAHGEEVAALEETVAIERGARGKDRLESEIYTTKTARIFHHEKVELERLLAEEKVARHEQSEMAAEATAQVVQSFGVERLRFEQRIQEATELEQELNCRNRAEHEQDLAKAESALKTAGVARAELEEALYLEKSSRSEDRTNTEEMFTATFAVLRSDISDLETALETERTGRTLDKEAWEAAAGVALRQHAEMEGGRITASQVFDREREECRAAADADAEFSACALREYTAERTALQAAIVAEKDARRAERVQLEEESVALLSVANEDRCRMEMHLASEREGRRVDDQRARETEEVLLAAHHTESRRMQIELAGKIAELARTSAVQDAKLAEVIASNEVQVRDALEYANAMKEAVTKANARAAEASVQSTASMITANGQIDHLTGALTSCRAGESHLREELTECRAREAHTADSLKTLRAKSGELTEALAVAEAKVTRLTELLRVKCSEDTEEERLLKEEVLNLRAELVQAQEAHTAQAALHDELRSHLDSLQQMYENCERDALDRVTAADARTISLEEGVQKDRSDMQATLLETRQEVSSLLKKLEVKELHLTEARLRHGESERKAAVAHMTFESIKSEMTSALTEQTAKGSEATGRAAEAVASRAAVEAELARVDALCTKLKQGDEAAMADAIEAESEQLTATLRDLQQDHSETLGVCQSLREQLEYVAAAAERSRELNERHIEEAVAAGLTTEAQLEQARQEVMELATDAATSRADIASLSTVRASLEVELVAKEVATNAALKARALSLDEASTLQQKLSSVGTELAEAHRDTATKDAAHERERAKTQRAIEEKELKAGLHTRALLQQARQEMMELTTDAATSRACLEAELVALDPKP